MLRVQTTWTGPSGGPFYTLMHFDGDTSGEAEPAATAVLNFWTAMQAAISSQVTRHVEEEVLRIDPATGNVTAVFTGAARPFTAGGATGSPLPWHTQGLMRWRTGVFIAGRELRGRTFIPGLTEDANDNGRPNSSMVTSANNAAATLIGAATADLTIWSPTHGVEHTAASGTLWNEWGLLRSRRD